MVTLNISKTKPETIAPNDEFQVVFTMDDADDIVALQYGSGGGGLDGLVYDDTKFTLTNVEKGSELLGTFVSNTTVSGSLKCNWVNVGNPVSGSVDIMTLTFQAASDLVEGSYDVIDVAESPTVMFVYLEEDGVTINTVDEIIQDGEAIPEPAEYCEVTFESNGGTDVTNTVVLLGEAVSEPTDPLRFRYVFDGWYADEALTTPYNFSSAVNTDTTLYAKWTVSSEDVVLNVTVTTPETISADDEFEVVFTMEDAVQIAGFQYGSSANNTQGFFYDDTKFTLTSVESGSGIFGTVSANTTNSGTIKTWWSTTNIAHRVTGTVEFMKMNFTAASDLETGSYDVVGIAEEPKITFFTLTNSYDFDEVDEVIHTGLTTMEEPEPTPAPPAPAPPAPDPETSGTCVLTYESNGGTEIMPSYVTCGSIVEMPIEPEKDGFEFVGWHTDTLLTNRHDFDDTLDSDMTVYAKWVSSTSNAGLLKRAIGSVITDNLTNYIQSDGDNSEIDELTFVDNESEDDLAEGKFRYNNGDWEAGVANGSIDVGREIYKRVKATGSAILDGQPIYIDGSTGENAQGYLADRSHYAKTIGLATEDINENAVGRVTTFGEVKALDTTGTLSGALGETWSDGDDLYLTDVAGQLTNVMPASGILVRVAKVIRSHAEDGILDVSVDCQIPHNDLNGLQGGTATERYHLTEDELTKLQDEVVEQDLTVYTEKTSLSSTDLMYAGGGEIFVVADIRSDGSYDIETGEETETYTSSEMTAVDIGAYSVSGANGMLYMLAGAGTLNEGSYDEFGNYTPPSYDVSLSKNLQFASYTTVSDIFYDLGVEEPVLQKIAIAETREDHSITVTDGFGWDETDGTSIEDAAYTRTNIIEIEPQSLATNSNNPRTQIRVHMPIAYECEINLDGDYVASGTVNFVFYKKTYPGLVPSNPRTYRATLTKTFDISYTPDGSDTNLAALEAKTSAEVSVDDMYVANDTTYLYKCLTADETSSTWERIDVGVDTETYNSQRPYDNYVEFGGGTGEDSLIHLTDEEVSVGEIYFSLRNNEHYICTAADSEGSTWVFHSPPNYQIDVKEEGFLDALGGWNLPNEMAISLQSTSGSISFSGTPIINGSSSKYYALFYDATDSLIGRLFLAHSTTVREEVTWASEYVLHYPDAYYDVASARFSVSSDYEDDGSYLPIYVLQSGSNAAHIKFSTLNSSITHHSIVTALPTTEIKNVMYLLEKEDRDENVYYEKYIYFNSEWVLIGETRNPVFEGATDELVGLKGLVPAPAIADKEKFLKGDGTWETIDDVENLGTYATEALFFAGLFDSDVEDGIYTAIITNNEYVANAKTRVLAVLQTDATEAYRSSHVTYTGNIGAFTKNVLYNISTSTTTRDLPITYNLLNANYSEEDVLDYINTISLQNLTDPPVITTNIDHEACQVMYKKSGTTLYAMFYFADRIKKVEYNLSTSTITTSVDIAYENSYDLPHNDTTVGDTLDDIEDALDILLSEV